MCRSALRSFRLVSLLVARPLHRTARSSAFAVSLRAQKRPHYLIRPAAIRRGLWMTGPAVVSAPTATIGAVLLAQVIANDRPEVYLLDENNEYPSTTRLGT